MITISIVTITYNASKVLQPTLDSMLMQSYPHVEHLIIDGASTDDTVQMAQTYKQISDEAENEHVVRIQSEPDKGLYDAMNKGLRMATGDYILFLNAGDRLAAADTLEQVSLFCEGGDGEESPAVVYGDTDIINEDGIFLYHRRLQPPETLTWKSFKNGMLVCHQAFYARLDIAQNIPYDTQYKYSADVDWCIKVMKASEAKGLSHRNVHAVVANYLQEGQTTLHHSDSLKERFRVMSRHYGLLNTVFRHAWFVIRKFIRK